MTKTIRMTILLGVLSIAATGAATGWSEWHGLSVWEKMKIQSLAVEGVVKSIAINDSSREIMVRVATQTNKSVTVKVCPEYHGQKFRHVMKTDKMEMLRQAMNEGRRVKVSTGGSFDSCVAHVEMTGI